MDHNIANEDVTAFMSTAPAFEYDERLGVRFGSAQLALRSWVIERGHRATSHIDGSFSFGRSWFGFNRRGHLVIAISPVPYVDATDVHVAVFGSVRSVRLMRRHCHQLLERLHERAVRASRDVKRSGPGGGLRVFAAPLRLQPIPIQSDDPEAPRTRV